MAAAGKNLDPAKLKALIPKEQQKLDQIDTSAAKGLDKLIADAKVLGKTLQAEA